MRKVILAAAVFFTLLSCTDKNPKRLVLYYSQSGNTKVVAEAIAACTGADIEAFDVKEPYAGTYEETIQRCLEERASGKLHAVVPIKSDLRKYDEIFIGYPIWFGTCARPVLSLLKRLELKGKTVVPFCTFGSGGLESSVKTLKNVIKGAEIKDGFGIRAARIDKADREIKDFLARGGYIDDIYELLRDFSEDEPLTDQTAACFDAACSDYPMPLGTPVCVASRKRAGGMEYRYSTESQDSEGRPALFTIYVFVSESGDAEFTKVVR